MDSSKFKVKSSKLQLKIQNSGHKIIRLLVLLGIREGYLLVRNVYGIVEHPFLTFGRIVKTKDLSQGILIFGLPAGLWIAWIFILLVSRFFIFGRLQFGFLAKTSFLASSLFTAGIFLFFGYWGFWAWKKGRRNN